MPTTTATSRVLRAHAHNSHGYLRQVADKRATRDLTDGQNRQARELFRRLLAEEWQGNQTAASKALGVHPSTLNKFASGAQGTSRATYDKLRATAGLDQDAENEPAALATVREIEETSTWDIATWKALAALATASSEPLTPSDLFQAGNSWEAQRRGRAVAARVVMDDPTDRKRKRGTP